MKRNKNNHMQEQIKFIAAILFLLIFLPILCTILLSGKKSLKFSQEKEIEQLLPSLVYQEIPDDSQLDMICAQAVLVRSRIWLECEDSDSKKDVYNRILGKNVEYERSYKMDAEKLSLCREAVLETDGSMLGYGGQVVEGPFCRASNGWTRGGKEVFGKDSYGWLVGVESKADLDFKADRKPMAFTEDELYEALTGKGGVEQLNSNDENESGTINKEGILDSITIVTADSSGYVTELTVGGRRMSGEAFRKALNLPSASFTSARDGEKLLFTCRGMGHGMGLSQYGANDMAKDGKNWRDILNYYFPNAQVIKDEKTMARTDNGFIRLDPPDF